MITQVTYPLANAITNSTEEIQICVDIKGQKLPLLTEKQYYEYMLDDDGVVSDRFLIRPHFEYLPTGEDHTVALNIDRTVFEDIPEGRYLIGLTIIAKFVSPGLAGTIEENLGLEFESSKQISSFDNSPFIVESATISLFIHKMYKGLALTLIL